MRGVREMGVKEEIKSEIIRQGFKLSDVVKALNNKYGRNDSLANLSNKLARGTLKYSEALEIADIIGCEILWCHKKDENS